MSPCLLSFLGGEISAAVPGREKATGVRKMALAHGTPCWGLCQGGSSSTMSLGATGTHRTPVENKEGLLKIAPESRVLAPSHSSRSTVERRQREVQGQSPVLSQVEQKLSPSSLGSPPIVKWSPSPILIFALPPPGLCPGQHELVQNKAEKLWG